MYKLITFLGKKLNNMVLIHSSIRSFESIPNRFRVIIILQIFKAKSLVVMCPLMINS